MTRIPLAKPAFDRRELEAVGRVFDGGWLVQGPEVEAFEEALAGMHLARHCIAASSGTAALHVCFLALEIGPGQAVFVPSFAWPSAANMAMAVGARPVFVDVLPDTYNIDPADLRVQIERCARRGWGQPRAVVPVHQFGLAADMPEILEVAEQYGLDVVEDAACALGATCGGRPVGTFGALGILSFHPRKSATTGEGGAILTNDDALARRCRAWRNHGQESVDGRREFRFPGMNYRMTDFQAAIGRIQLAKFPETLPARRQLAASYLEKLADCSHLALPGADDEHTWQTFMIVLHDDCDRQRFIDKLRIDGISAGPGSVSGHCTEVYRERFGYRPSDLPQSTRLHHQGLALPLHSFMEASSVEECVRAFSLQLSAFSQAKHV